MSYLSKRSPQSSSSASSSHSRAPDFRNPTPLKNRLKNNNAYVFPVVMPEGNYLQNETTGLRDYNRKSFVYSEDLSLDKEGIKSNNFDVSFNEVEYVYKHNFLKSHSLPADAKRARKDVVLAGDIYHSEVYNSHSKVMTQIMLRNISKLILKDYSKIIIPEMYPVVNSENGEVCGHISEKIDCDGVAFRNTESHDSQQLNINTGINNIVSENKIPSLMAILGIYGLCEKKGEPSNIGITDDDELVLFHFNRNLVDERSEFRRCSLSHTLNKKDWLLKEDLENSGEILSSYLTNFNTRKRNVDIDEDIAEIVMNWGPGDKDSRLEIGQAIQSRINDALNIIDANANR